MTDFSTDEKHLSQIFAIAALMAMGYELMSPVAARWGFEPWRGLTRRLDI